jgi:hypothetical protein
MRQEDKTFSYNRLQSHRTQAGGGCPNHPLRNRQICARLRDFSYFLVTVIADGEVILMVLPSTVPAYFVLPAVKVISLPRSRP